MFKSPMRGVTPVPGKRSEDEILARPEGSTAAGALNPKARPTKSFLLRLNNWQLARIRKLAEREGLSLQCVVKRALMRAIDEELEPAKRKHS